jgi:hypothetical protein
MPRRTTRELKVTVSFESNRLEEQNICMAYELIVPIKQGPQQTKTRSKPKKLREVEIQQLQIFSAVSNL